MATTATPSDISADRPTLFRSRRILLWAIGGIFFINFIGGALHFAFELSNYSRIVALFASVNESTWEHLKFYFWASLLFALIEYTYVREEASNFAFAKALSFLTLLFTITMLFYAYVGITVPLYGQGSYLGVVLIGVLGVIFGQIVGSYFLQTRQLSQVHRYVGIGIIVVLTIMFLLFTFFPPEFFLFEDFLGYEYKGQYGILEDYEPYRVFGSVTSVSD